MHLSPLLWEWGIRDQWIPGIYWSINLDKLVSSRFSERLGLKKEGSLQQRETVGVVLAPYMYAHIPLFTHVHPHRHMYTSLTLPSAVPAFQALHRLETSIWWMSQVVQGRQSLGHTLRIVFSEWSPLHAGLGKFCREKGSLSFLITSKVLLVMVFSSLETVPWNGYLVIFDGTLSERQISGTSWSITLDGL